MVAARTDNEILPPQSLMQVPAVRQLGIMLGIAASVAIGVAVVLWSQTPNYALLYSSMAEKEVSEVLDSLNKLNIDYKIDAASGSVLVPAGKLDELRLKLAGQGLPRGGGIGFELLEKESSFGTSQLVEQARYQRAIEGEIARSITSIQNVRSARIHLALPKQSAFVRKRKKASASVFVNLYSGRGLEKGQVEAIVHLVASSVPQLESSNVTLVDQSGRLLSSESGSSDVLLTSKQFDYKQQVENHLIDRIETILTPLVGSSGMRAQVTADIDFTITERTQDSYNPEMPSLRSEQTEEQLSQTSSVQGVPGALSNQPPAAGVAPETATTEGAVAGDSQPLNSTKRATRNFELDKTITHTRLASGEIGRLSVAVVIDDQHLLGQDGNATQKAYTEEELMRMTSLVKQAVGFDVVRGDVVTVSNISFKMPEVLEALPELEIWEQGWFWDVVKQALGGLVVLFLIFGVLRPTLRSLMKPVEIKTISDAGEGVDVDGQKALPAGAEGGMSSASGEAGEEEILMLDSPSGYEKRVEFAQKMVDDDPKRVAQVVKTWVSTDG